MEPVYHAGVVQSGVTAEAHRDWHAFSGADIDTLGCMVLPGDLADQPATRQAEDVNHLVGPSIAGRCCGAGRVASVLAPRTPAPRMLLMRVSGAQDPPGQQTGA